MNKIIKDIKEALNTDNKTKAYDTQAKVIRSEGQTLWVHIPGGVDETPVKKTINAKAGDTVQVRVSGGSAWLVGNQSAPPTDDTTAIIADRKASEVRGIATSAQELSEKAEQTAISAQISANGKNTIYYNASAPTGGTYKLGDTWFNSSEDNAIYTWNGSSWVKEELGEDAIANLSITNAKIANGTIQNGKIANLDAGKITTGDLSAAVMKTNAVSAINATVDKIDAKNIKASQIAVGDLSDGSNYSTTTQMNTAIGNAIPRVTYNGVMTSSNGTYAKVATCKAFSLVTGAVISLYMSGSELNAAALTLNINDTGAKDIYVGNDAVSATNRLNWLYGCTITFVYDGTHYVVADNPPVYSGETCSTAESTAQKDTVVNRAVLFKGTTVTVPMTNSNTAATPTLRINNSGGTAITASNVYFGSGSTSPTKANGYAWPAGAAVIFTFDGQYWRFGNQTFIDGGNILTGTISADRIGANSLTIGKLSSSVQTSLGKADNSARFARLSQAGNATTASNNPWFKIASVVIDATYTQASITFDVSHLYTGTYNPKGKLNVYIRKDANGYVSTTESKITWTDATEDIKSKLSDFVIAYKPNDKPSAVEVWARIPNTYWTLVFKSLNETYSTSVDYTKWTLYNNSSTDAKASVTTGYSTIASKVDASSQYVTKITDNGIYVSPSSQTPSSGTEGNSVKIDGTGMEVFLGSTSVAKYGETARIGEETAYHTVVEPDSFSILNGDEDVFTVDSNGGSRTEVRTKVSLHENRLQRSGNYETTRSVTFTAGREYTFKLYTSTTQTVTKTFPQTGSTSFSLTGTLNGSTNTITFTPLYSSQGRVKFRMVRTVTVSSGYANCATFEATYNITADIPMLNIGGITYTDIGRVIKGGYEAQPSITDISASANTSYTLGSVDLDAGVWVIAVRARFTPSASGAHVSQITISNSSTPTSTALDRLYAEATYFNQHNATFVLMPANDEPLTYYVHGTATVAGKWNRTSDAAFSIRAVKIR